MIFLEQIQQFFELLGMPKWFILFIEPGMKHFMLERFIQLFPVASLQEFLRNFDFSHSWVTLAVSSLESGIGENVVFFF